MPDNKPGNRENKPGYHDWKSQPDLSGETPDSDSGHRIIFWLWIIGMIIFSGLVWLLAKLTANLTPAGGAHV